MISISVVTGILAAVLIIVKKHTKIASKWLCICWAVLALRLLIPFNLPLSIVNMEIPDTQVSQGTAAVYETLPTEQTSAYTENTAAAHKSQSVDFLEIALWVWIVGAAVFALWQITLYFTERKRMLRWSRMADSETCAKAEKAAESIGVKRNFKVLICETETPPMLMGVLRPVLFLPAGLKQHQLEIVLCHELTHLKRQDILFKILVTAANAVHWFNPIVHLMAKEADKDTESACDEAVLCNADKARRRNYCDTILDMMRGRRIPFATALTYKKEDIMKRFVNILDTSKKKSGLVLTVILLCLSVVLCGLAGCENKTDNSKISDNNMSQTDSVLNGDISAVSDENRDAIIADIAGNYNDDGETVTDGYMDIQTAMELINEYRVQNGLPELIMGDVKLNEAALIRLEEIKESFSHTRPNGESWKTVFEENYITYTHACENLARGQMTANQVVEDWLSSEMHRSNLLNPDITHVHVACDMGKEETEFEDYVYWIFLGYAS